MQDIKNYVRVFVIGSSVLIFLYFFFLTRREIKLEKKFNSFALSTTKETKTLLDGIENISLRILKIFSKITKKSRVFKALSKKYEKYVLLSETIVTTLDIITLKNILFLLCFIITFVFEYLNIINITYISVVLVSFISYFLPDIVINIKYANRKKGVSREIVDTIILINNNLKKGLNIIDAIDDTILQVPKDLEIELRKVKFDLENGLSIASSFKHFNNRMDIPYTTYISETIARLYELKLSNNEIFSYLALKLKERKDDLEKSIMYSRGARIFYKITISIPIIIVLLLIMFKPDYFMFVMNSLPALLIFISLILIYISYIILGNRLMKGK